MQSNKFGVLVPYMGNSQLAFELTLNTNAFLAKHPEKDVCVFYENQLGNSYKSNFALMNIYHAWQYGASLIATSLTTASKLLHFPADSSTRKFFYVYDLEWVFMRSKVYKELAHIYQNKDLVLVARSENHKKVIEDCWDTKVHHVIEGFDIEKFSEILT